MCPCEVCMCVCARLRAFERGDACNIRARLQSNLLKDYTLDLAYYSFLTHHDY